MTKKELIKAIKTCKEVKINCFIHEHFGMYVKAVKADVIWSFKYETKELESDEIYKAQMLSDNTLLLG